MAKSSASQPALAPSAPPILASPQAPGTSSASSASSAKTVPLATILGGMPRGSELRLDVETRIEALIKRGKTDDEIRADVVPQLAASLGQDEAPCRRAVDILITLARQG